MDRTLATRAEIALHLGVPVATLAQWAYRSTGPKYLRVGRHTRYRWRDVEAWLNQQEIGGGTAA